MKSVLIISGVTFLLIFGGIAVMSLQLGQQNQSAEDLDPTDQAAGERLLRDVAEERDRIQGEREYLAGLNQSQAAQAYLMEQVHTQLMETVSRLDERQEVFIDEQSAAADKLAKMYEAMKPQRAAVIISALDMDIALSILSRMKERSAARVLGFMDAGQAAQISTRLSMKEGA